MNLEQAISTTLPPTAIKCEGQSEDSGGLPRTDRNGDPLPSETTLW